MNKPFSSTAHEIKSLLNRDRVHLCFISFEYFSIFDIWFSYIEKFSIDNLCIVALDHKCYSELQKRSIKSVFMQSPDIITPKNKRLLWTQRVNLIHDLINLDITVLHSDADAFWLKDFSSYLENNTADLIFSIAHGIPKNLVEKWGFILCCGFFEIKSNDNTKKFMIDYLKRCRDVGDDQKSLNWLLFEKGISWRNIKPGHKHGECNYYNILIDAIPKKTISRSPIKGISIFHPYLPSNDISKKLQQALSSLKLC